MTHSLVSLHSETLLPWVRIQLLCIVQDRQKKYYLMFNIYHLSNRGTISRNNSAPLFTRRKPSYRQKLLTRHQNCIKKNLFLNPDYFIFHKALARLLSSDTRKISPSSEIPELIIVPHILPSPCKCMVKPESSFTLQSGQLISTAKDVPLPPLQKKKKKKKVASFCRLFGAALWLRCIEVVWNGRGGLPSPSPGAAASFLWGPGGLFWEAQRPPAQGCALEAAKWLSSKALHPGTHLNFSPGCWRLPFRGG